MRDERLPWEPFARKARIPMRYHTTPTRGDYARALGVEISTIDAWKRLGIPWHKADRIAVEVVGVHPGSIWPEWWTV